MALDKLSQMEMREKLPHEYDGSRKEDTRVGNFCPHCGKGTDLAELVDKAVDEKLGNYFGEVRNKTNSVFPKVMDLGVFKPSDSYFSYHINGLIGFCAKAAGLGTLINYLAPSEFKTEAFVGLGLYLLGDIFGKLSRGSRMRLTDYKIYDIKDRLKAYPKQIND